MHFYIFFLHIIMNMFKSKEQGWQGGAKKNMSSFMYKLEPIQVEVGASTK